MLVDLARNDVARVSVPGTRRVDRLLDVVRYSQVMHLESRVSACSPMTSTPCTPTSRR